jgi:sulfur carrier protein
MRLEVNGEATEVPEGLTIQGLLEHLKVGGGRVAVEVNREVIRREAHAAHRLAPGDRVEIVAFVGGG